MKTNTNFILGIIAASAAGVVTLALSDAVVATGFTLSELLGFVSAAALVAFAVSDYSRRPSSLGLTRRGKHSSAAPRTEAAPRLRATAYGLPRRHRARIAA